MPQRCLGSYASVRCVGAQIAASLSIPPDSILSVSSFEPLLMRVCLLGRVREYRWKQLVQPRSVLSSSVF